MFQSVVRALITILIIALCVVLILWVLSFVGIALPVMVVRIIWAIAILLMILVAYRLLKPQIDKLLNG